MNNNFNRRQIDQMKIFEEVYKANQIKEMNIKNKERQNDFNKRMFGIRQNDLKENSVSGKVNNLNQKIASNNTIQNASKLTNFKGNFK